MAWLNRFVARAELPEGATMTVFDLEGTVVARTPPGGFVGRNEARSELYRAARAGHAEVVERAGLDGVTRMYGFDTLDAPEGPIAYISFGVPSSVLFADANGELRRNVTMLVVVALLALELGWIASSRMILRPVERLTSAAVRLREGDLDARVQDAHGPREQVILARSFNEMAESLSSRTAELEARLTDLRRSDAARRRLLGRLVHAQEEERRRIAEDIHDESIQMMVAAALRLGTVRLRASEPEVRDALEGVEADVQRAIERLRSVLFELSPQFLERDGVAAALRRYASESFAGEGTVVRIDDHLPAEPPPETQVVLYRTTQGALANVRAHANASSVRVELTAVDGGVKARVVDDGVGLDTTDLREMPGHLGLATMREHVELAGGWLRIEGRPGHGTTLECFVPGAVRPSAEEPRPATANAVEAVP